MSVSVCCRFKVGGGPAAAAPAPESSQPPQGVPAPHREDLRLHLQVHTLTTLNSCTGKSDIQAWHICHANINSLRFVN